MYKTTGTGKLPYNIILSTSAESNTEDQRPTNTRTKEDIECDL